MENFRVATENDTKILAIMRQKSWEFTYRGIYSDDMIDKFDYSLHEKKFVTQIRNPEIKVYVLLSGDELTDIVIHNNILKM